MPRPVMLAGLLGAAVGVPYAIDQSDEWRGNLMPASASVPGQVDFANPNATISPDMPTLSSPGDHLYRSPAPLEGIPTYSLADVLRVDITKEWVYSRWARKSTGLAEADLFGVRVPLVSGTRMTDVAGSLTYYFNVNGQVEKIRLLGKTADTTELVNLLSKRYSFRPATPQLAGEQLFRVENSGRIESELITRPESVLWATSPHESFSVDLEINRAGSGRYVKRRPLKLQAIDTPPEQPEPLFGQQQPVGKPVLPGESFVPSTNGVKAQQASASMGAEKAAEASEAAIPKKVPLSPLRWPN